LARRVDGVLADSRLPWAVVVYLTVFSLTSIVVALEPGLAGPVSGTIEGAVERVEQVANAPLAAMPAIIFANNLLVALRDALLAFTVVVPVFDMVLNGAVVGYVVASVAEEVGGYASPFIVYSLLAPHGSLELPAIALAASSAAWVTAGIRAVFRSALRNLAVAAVMLAVAAAAEVAVTPVAAVIAFLLS